MQSVPGVFFSLRVLTSEVYPTNKINDTATSSEVNSLPLEIPPLERKAENSSPGLGKDKNHAYNLFYPRKNVGFSSCDYQYIYSFIICILCFQSMHSSSSLSF